MCPSPSKLTCVLDTEACMDFADRLAKDEICDLDFAKYVESLLGPYKNEFRSGSLWFLEYSHARFI